MTCHLEQITVKDGLLHVETQNNKGQRTSGGCLVQPVSQSRANLIVRSL